MSKLLDIAGKRIRLGQRRTVELEVSQSYAGAPIHVPVLVWRAERPGPTVYVTAAVHGDELNGTGIVRELILRPGFELAAGTLLLVPVINVLGFERHMRYLPDRRDLNRSFPGSAGGSLARRFAHVVFQEIVRKSDVGIDLHTAAVRRTNFPNVRADLKNSLVADVAAAFGCELIVHGRGPKGSLRRESCANGCGTVILEAGEVWKIEPTVVEVGVRGVRNVLTTMGMVEGEPVAPPYQVRVEETVWIRADSGGMLDFHVAPGESVEKGQPLATSTNLLGESGEVILSPSNAVVLGMSTLPAVAPGTPICHLAVPEAGDFDRIREVQKRLGNQSLHERIREDLAASVAVSDPNQAGKPASGSGGRSPGPARRALDDSPRR